MAVQERIGKHLEVLERQRAVGRIGEEQTRESKKSIIGRMNNESEEARRANERLQDKARENNIPESMFSMEDDAQYKLKRADWLEHVCFEGTVSETLKRQGHYFNSVEQYDSLLESAFNLLDVTEASAVNRILDDSALTHVQRAQHRQYTKMENDATNEDDELEGFLRVALQKTG